MNKPPKKTLFIILYVSLLFIVGFFLLILTSHSKINSRIEIIRDRSNSIDKRISALAAVSRYNEEEVADIIIECLQDPSPYIRIEGAFYAGELTKEEFEHLFNVELDYDEYKGKQLVSVFCIPLHQ